MLTFLFWNFKSKNPRVLASLVHQHKVDVLILAECPVPWGTMLPVLNQPAAEFFYAQSDCRKIQLYTRFHDQFVLPVKKGTDVIKGNDYSFRRLALPGRVEVLLCAVHFPSKLLQHTIDQSAFTMRFSAILAEAEKAVTHNRTVLVGDLNMNPYDDAVVSTTGLHAVMTRRIAQRETRTVKFESNLFFYNPMWSHFGEQKEGHAGTYYYASPKARADYWNIYDQVLVRPDLLPHFRDEDVSILWRDQAGGESLLMRDGRPNSRDISDHLPVLFRLTF